MAFQPKNLTTKGVDPAADCSPVRRLLYVSSQGMVFKSATHFDSGTRLAVGLHLRKICGDLGLSGEENGLFGDRFLQLEGLVADSKIVAVSPLERHYQVTLIFDKLSEADRILLEAVERSRHTDPRPDNAGAMTNPKGGVKIGSSLIPGMGGLN